MNKWSNYGKWRHPKKRKELMKNIDIKNNTLDKQYQSLLQDILDNGVSKKDRTGTGTLSVFGRQIRHKMKDGFPLLTTKKMAWKSIVTELLWFLRGDTNIKYLVDNGCHIWDGDCFSNYLKNRDRFSNKDNVNEDVVINGMNGSSNRAYTKEEFINKIKTDDEFAKKWGDLGPVYGKQWRSWNDNIDQISDLIKQLKENPDSRRLLVSAWNPTDLPNQVLPPCHYGFQVYTRELSLEERLQVWNIKFGFTNEEQKNQFDPNVHLDTHGVPTRAISLMWNQRSVDTLLGLPFNIASYGLLLEIIAKSVNMIPDELIGNLGDTHLYSNHIEQAKEQIGREPYTLPTLNINTEFWPTESGECGTGLLDAIKIFNSFTNDNFCKCLLEEDIQLSNYKSHEKINAQLSN
jgi:thymidylate synthase